MVKFSLKGVGSSVDVYTDRIEIKPSGLLGLAEGKGDKTILIKDITSIQVRTCSFYKGGFIQFSVLGTNEIDNRINFGGFFGRKIMNETALDIKNFLLGVLNQK